MDTITEVKDLVPDKQDTKAAIQKQRQWQDLSPFEQRLNMEFREAKGMLASKFLPERFDTVEKVWAALRFAKEHFPLTPLTAVRQIAIINGVPALFGELPLAKCEATGKMKHFRNYVIDKDGNEICKSKGNLGAEAIAGVCEIQREGRHLEEYIFTVEQAKKAGLWEKKGFNGKPTPWVLYPERMLKMRARSEALKDNFSDALSGLAIGEYDLHTTAEEVEAQPVNPAGSPDELNQKFLNQTEPSS